MAEHNEIGKYGENLAVDYLKSKGYQIESLNWRHRKAEIDIIAKIDDTMIFVEVKTRSTDYFGQPEEFVTEHKEKLMVDAAAIYCEEVGHDWAIRFDIISILLNKAKPDIKHYEDAFFPSN